MFKSLQRKEKKIAVIGLGYVGLPVALEFAKYFKVIGFDISASRIEQMKQRIDPSEEMSTHAFEGKDIEFTANPEDLKNAHFYIVTVPTPVDEHKVPDLTLLIKASITIGKYIKKGDYVVYESTVYPGCTEEDCIPVIEQYSGLKLGKDFKAGYSPERISPGDKGRSIDKILKIVSGSDADALENVSKVYGQIITAGIYEAQSIKVAEAAKVIENTQRDLNISLMNELAMIFDRMGIDTQAVIDAAATKWNFLKLKPGLVGGHCICVDPYYLTHKSIQMGYDPQVILSGRRINDSMPAWIAKKLTQLLIQRGKNPGKAKVLVLGITFKENVSDIRNSKVADLVHELMHYSINIHLYDPFASANEVAHEYKLTLSEKIGKDYDAVVVAVAHDEFKKYDLNFFKSIMKKEPILLDLKGLYAFDKSDIYSWRL